MLARLISKGMLAAIIGAGAAQVAWAGRLEVAPGSGALQAAADAAADGDTLVLQPGHHRGPVVVRKALVVEGEPGAIVEGPGSGSVVRVEAPGAVVRGLIVRGSGADLETMDSGVFVERDAKGALVANNRIEGNLFGIYLHGAENAVAKGNTIVGLRSGRVNEAGNGVSVWNAPGAQVVDNDISFGRDGIFSISSKRNLYARNRFHDLRFAVHYMYTNDSEISDNVSAGNAVGYALMFSNRLVVRGNVSDHDRAQGFIFNYANGSQVMGNLVLGGPQPVELWTSRGARLGSEHGVPAPGRPAVPPLAGSRIGPEKCVFIYNANHNRFRNNWFERMRDRHPFHRRIRGQRGGRKRVRRKSEPGEICRHPLSRLVEGRAGKLLERQPGVRPRRDGIAEPRTAQRPRGQGALDCALSQGPRRTARPCR